MKLYGKIIHSGHVFMRFGIHQLGKKHLRHMQWYLVTALDMRLHVDIVEFRHKLQYWQSLGKGVGSTATISWQRLLSREVGSAAPVFSESWSGRATNSGVFRTLATSLSAPGGRTNCSTGRDLAAASRRYYSVSMSLS